MEAQQAANMQLWNAAGQVQDEVLDSGWADGRLSHPLTLVLASEHSLSMMVPPFWMVGTRKITLLTTCQMFGLNTLRLKNWLIILSMESLLRSLLSLGLGERLSLS